MKKEWREFEVDLSQRHLQFSSCQRMKEVHHTSHVEVALQILRDGYVKAYPSYEYRAFGEKKARIAWTSANRWHDGSRYGGVNFHFPIDRLLRKKRVYWAGVNADNQRPRCQFLLTENNYNKVFQPYSPQKNRGPWRIKDGEHYFNGEVVIELMHDHDLSLDLAERISFSTHHEHQCSQHLVVRDCPEAAYFGNDACQHWLRRVGGRGMDLSQKKHLWPYKKDHPFSLTAGLDKMLHAPFLKIKYTGVQAAKGFPSKALARSALHAAATGNNQEAKQIAGLFSSEEQLAEAFSEVLCDSLGLSINDYVKERMQRD